MATPAKITLTERDRESGRIPEVCAHPDCVCEIDADPVKHQGRNFCSDGCATGRGCDHVECRCGVEPDD